MYDTDLSNAFGNILSTLVRQSDVDNTPHYSISENGERSASYQEVWKGNYPECMTVANSYIENGYLDMSSYVNNQFYPRPPAPAGMYWMCTDVKVQELEAGDHAKLYLDYTAKDYENIDVLSGDVRQASKMVNVSWSLSYQQINCSPIKYLDKTPLEGNDYDPLGNRVSVTKDIAVLNAIQNSTNPNSPTVGNITKAFINGAILDLDYRQENIEQAGLHLGDAADIAKYIKLQQNVMVLQPILTKTMTLNMYHLDEMSDSALRAWYDSVIDALVGNRKLGKWIDIWQDPDFLVHCPFEDIFDPDPNDPKKRQHFIFANVEINYPDVEEYIQGTYNDRTSWTWLGKMTIKFKFLGLFPDYNKHYYGGYVDNDPNEGVIIPWEFGTL